MVGMEDGIKRAFMDNGNVLGSIQNEECRIDAIAQKLGKLFQVSRR